MGELIHDYHDGNRHFHDRFDTRRVADRAAEVRTSSIFEHWAKEFIERSNMFFIATCDHRGLPTCSYKGGERGFVRVIDDHWLAFPNYDGNGRYLSMGNVLKNPSVGLLFIDFEAPGRVRVQGEARIDEHDALMASYPGAQFIVRVRATEVFRNARAISTATPTRASLNTFQPKITPRLSRTGSTYPNSTPTCPQMTRPAAQRPNGTKVSEIA